VASRIIMNVLFYLCDSAEVWRDPIALKASYEIELQDNHTCII
jgi:hypothetical protein